LVLCDALMFVLATVDKSHKCLASATLSLTVSGIWLPIYTISYFAHPLCFQELYPGKRLFGSSLISETASYSNRHTLCFSGYSLRLCFYERFMSNSGGNAILIRIIIIYIIKKRFFNARLPLFVLNAVSQVESAILGRI
jgi:hypothetical protein